MSSTIIPYMIGTCTQTISRCQQKKAERRKRKRMRICTVALYPRVNEEGGLYSGVKHIIRRSYTGYGKMTKAPMFRKNRANDDIVMDSSVEVVVQILNTPVKTQTMKVYQRKNKAKVGRDIPNSPNGDLRKEKFDRHRIRTGGVLELDLSLTAAPLDALPIQQ
ncbi:hypothetical protein ACLB2K_053100 [Fragaria x ananassa]